jgi:glycerol uptake facilitator-like aquaporin
MDAVDRLEKQKGVVGGKIEVWIPALAALLGAIAGVLITQHLGG